MHAPFHALGIHTASTCDPLEDIEDPTVHGHGKFRLTRELEFHIIGVVGLFSEDPDRLQQVAKQKIEWKSRYDRRSLYALEGGGSTGGQEGSCNGPLSSSSEHALDPVVPLATIRR
jgi:hypothetical protein